MHQPHSPKAPLLLATVKATLGIQAITQISPVKWKDTWAIPRVNAFPDGVKVQLDTVADVVGDVVAVVEEVTDAVAEEAKGHPKAP